MKKYRTVFLISGLIWVSVLILALFYDFRISSHIADPLSGFGRLLELVGEPPAILWACFNLSLVIAKLWKMPSRGRREAVLIGMSLFALVAATVYTVSATFSYIVGWQEDAGVPSLPTAVSTCLTVGITFAVTVFLLWLPHRLSYAALVSYFDIAVCCVKAALLTLAVIWGIKLLWGRVRFRQLTSPEDFTPFWRPNGFTGYFSFPSGHTANAAVIITFLYYLPILRQKKKLPYTAIKILLFSWIIVLAFSRVLVGAHYLSDVLCGGAITLIIVWFCRPKSEPNCKSF